MLDDSIPLYLNFPQTPFPHHTNTMRTDNDLLESIKQRNKAAMQSIYFKYTDKLCAYIKSQLIDSKYSLNVLYDTMYNVWVKCKDWDMAHSVEVWLLKIARQTTHDYNYRIESGEHLPALLTQNSEFERPQRSSHKRPPCTIRQCLKKLDCKQRSTLHLTFYHGLSYEEIATVEGVHIQDIEQRFLTAKTELKRLLNMV